jgi:hypothetical protein
MTTPEITIRELPLRRGGDPLSPRLPVEELSHSSEPLIRYRVSQRSGGRPRRKTSGPYSVT